MRFEDEKPIIAVTGSAGKTTVKTLISAILRERWIVFESNDYNNTTAKTKDHKEMIEAIHRAVVLEYGMAYPGVITEHCSIIRPNIGIITNVGFAHLGNFEGDLKKLAAAKSEMITGIEKDGLLFINADDQNSKLLHTHLFKGELFTVGIDEQANYQAKEILAVENGQEFSVQLDGNDYKFFIPLIGIHNIYNALFAIGVAHQLGFTNEEIKTGLQNVKTPEHRLNIHHLKDGITVIDDTVHATYQAMVAAIDVLDKMEGKKKIAILGSMPELGDRIEEYHHQLGKYVATKKIDYLYTYGNISVHIGYGAVENGLKEAYVKHKTPLYRRVMHKELLELIEKDTVILVKGASRLGMYDTVQFLCDHYKVSD